MYLRPQIRTIDKQRGAILFVALVFLVLLTLLGLAASSGSILQERMTGGMRNRQLSLMGAETAARGGEVYLWNLSSLMVGTQPMPPCIGNGDTNCVYRPSLGVLDPQVQAFRTSKAWIDPAADGARDYVNPMTALTGSDATASLSEQPRFLIEDLGPDVPPGGGKRGGGWLREGPGSAGKHEFYRITARSQGASDAVVRAVETVFSAADLTNTGYNP